MATVKEIVNMVLEEVQTYVKKNGYVPKQVMLLDKEFNLVRKENIEYDGVRVRVVNCGRVINEECYKSSKNRTY